jgi:hypothetical protein
MWPRARGPAVVAACCVVAGLAVVSAPGLPAAPAAAQAASDVGAVYVPVGPVRVLDTRDGTGAPQAPVGPGGVVSLQVTGSNGVPSSGVTGVVLNVTATDTTASSYVTVYPDGETRPTASNLNFTAGETIPNLVTVPVGSDGAVDFYNNTGSTDLVADLEGYYTTTGSGSLLDSVGPVRVLDTRNGTGGYSSPVGPGGTISLQVEGVDGVPAAGVTAVALNVTATNPTASSYVTVYPDGETRPTASNLNFTAGETIPNLVVAPVGADGAVDFYNFAGSTDLVADLSGYYTAAGAGYTPLGPVRVLDTRNGTGAPQAPVGPGGTISLQVTGVAGVPATGVTAVVLNVTATDPTVSSFVTVYPSGQEQPTASNLNFTAGETIPNLVVVPVLDGGTIELYNNTGFVNLVADLAGYYTAGGAPWNDAIEVPGTAVLNTGAYAAVSSVSCPSAGNCTVGGYYTVSPGDLQAFVADESGGTWGDAAQVPGTAALNVGNDAEATSVSCASAGNCAAGGYFADSPDQSQAFVADEVGGTWGDAVQVPGTVALNVGNIAAVTSVSCSSAGNCTAGGYYSDSSSGGRQAFVASEVNWTWGDAIEVPGSAALNTGDYAQVASVSCASPGNCAAGGWYEFSLGNGLDGAEAFVVSEVNGTWADAIEVPGTAALNVNDFAQVASVSCASAGSCTAGGWYAGTGSPSDPGNQPFVVSEVNGIWGDATEVPGTRVGRVLSVSCPSAGNCVAGGDAAASFVVGEVNGTWGAAIQVPGTAIALYPGYPVGSEVTSVSCASAGNCVAGGDYTNYIYRFQFVVSEVNGTWGAAIQIPGTPFVAGAADEIGSVSCPPTGGCAVGGEYDDVSNNGHAFVASQN